MTAVAQDDAWMERCLVSISLLGGSEISAHAYTETIDIDRGEKDIEGKPTTAGGRIQMWKPEGDTTCTLEIYTVEAGNGKGFIDLLHPQTDSTQPLAYTNNRTRTRCRIAMLWSQDTGQTTAVAVTNANYPARRITLANGFVTGHKDSFTDGILKTTLTYKTTAFDKTGAVGQIKDESTDGTATLPALAAYTSTATPFA